MITIHPRRWFDFGVGWGKELVGQNIENVAKAAMIRWLNDNVIKVLAF